MQELERSTWIAMNKVEKDAAMRSLLSRLPQGFEYQGLTAFQRYGKTNETGIFTYKDSEFLFIPGDQATLGWERWEHGMDEATQQDLIESLSEYDIEDSDQFLRDQMSPLRQAIIGAMLVERVPRSAGWQEVPLEELSVLDEPEVESELAIFRASTYSEYERHLHFRLIRQEEGIVLYMFNEDLTYDQAVSSLLDEGFSLLTEDEWEYCYGGGCRTFFPWGDSFDYNFKLKHFEDLNADNTSREYDLELPNAFGLHFTGDPYQCEWTTREGLLMPKGGDGGSMICGGTGVVVGYLPAAAVYYRDPYHEEVEWDDMMGHLHYRRIVRL